MTCTNCWGRKKHRGTGTFQDGDFAIFRLTPDEYHYNHAPVSGVVVDCYEVDGTYHSCNPGPIISVVTPYSKNKRVVTVIDTDVPGGTQAGLVAMIEIVALMIGAIDQRYSERFYDNPQKMEAGLFVKKGQPKSLYRPGSSTDVLLFQRGRVDFCQDLRLNQLRRDAVSSIFVGFRTSGRRDGGQSSLDHRTSPARRTTTGGGQPQGVVPTRAMSDVPHSWPDNHGELSLLFLGIVSLAVFFLFSVGLCRPPPGTMANPGRAPATPGRLEPMARAEPDLLRIHHGECRHACRRKYAVSPGSDSGSTGHLPAVHAFSHEPGGSCFKNHR